MKTCTPESFFYLMDGVLDTRESYTAQSIRFILGSSITSKEGVDQRSIFSLEPIIRSILSLFKRTSFSL
jgi:hypothetical protein